MAELIKKIDEAISELASAASPDWMSAPLSDGLARLKTILKFFNFFGHEMAIEELLIFNQKVESLRKSQQADPNFLSKFESRRLIKALEITVLLGNLFILPDQVVSANDRYVGWVQNLVISSTQTPPAPLMLPPPVAVLPSPAGISEQKK